MSIPGSASPLLLASTAAAAGGLQISRSIRLNSADSAYFSRTPAVAGNRRTWTWSGWVKRSELSSINAIFGASNNGLTAYFTGSPATLNFYDYSGSFRFDFATTQLFRDPSAWMHMVFAVDTTLATSTDRVKIYVNGSQITTFGTASYPTQNLDTGWNDSAAHKIGSASVSSDYFNGYLANIHSIDGQQLTPSSFTETDATTGQLIPKTYTGSYGTNGFNLLFADNSSNTASTLGKDTSGLSNNWTPNNFSVTGIVNYASNVTTVATSVYSGTPATMFNGGTSIYYGVTSSSGNSSISIDLTGKGVSVSSSIRVYATFRTGQVWQINGSTVSSSGVTHPNTGWQTLSGWSAGAITLFSNSVPSGNANEIYAIEIDGVILTNNTGAGNDSLVDSPTNYGTDTGVGGEVRGNYATLNPVSIISTTTLSNGNLESIDTGSDAISLSTIGVSSGKWYWEITGLDITGTTSNQRSVIGIVKNPQLFALSTYVGSNANGFGYYSGNGQKLTSGTGSSYGATWATGNVMGVALDLDNGTLVFYKNNTSQGTAFTGLNTGDTYFPAASQAGSGKVAFNFGQRAFAYTAPSGFKALCTQNLPAPLVTKSNTVFDVVTYTGTGAARSITGLAFNPDLVWIKCRDAAYYHILTDSVRGTNKQLFSNDTLSEESRTDRLTSFDSTGFSLGSYGDVNNNGNPFVGWAWDAGTSTVSNTAGSITSQVRANATAGFSVATFTGATTGTIGHGLGVAPSMIIMKARTSNPGANDWLVYHKTLGNTKYLMLNSTAAEGTYTIWNNTSPTSTVFSIGSGIGTPDWVAYAFAPVVGYSSFGSYTGNGSTDGPFVYTGFRPRWLMYKRTDVADPWVVFDSVRGTYNLNTPHLIPNSANAEASAPSYGLDFLSNGFKPRVIDTSINASGGTYIYAAFAEMPFNYSRAR